MMEIQIKALVFDFGNVLAFFSHKKTCEKLALISNTPWEVVYEKLFKSEFSKRFERGETSAETFYKEVLKSLDITEKDLSFKSFDDAWSDIFTPHDGVEEMLKELKVPFFLLSNTNELHWEFIKKLPAMKYFPQENMILSYKEGARKPELEIYKRAIDKTGVDIKQILYIDDIPEFIETFKALGGNGFVYNAERENISILKKYLESHNVL